MLYKVVFVALLLFVGASCSGPYYGHSIREWKAMKPDEQAAAQKEYAQARSATTEMIQEASPSKTTREFVEGRDYSYPKNRLKQP